MGKPKFLAQPTTVANYWRVTGPITHHFDEMGFHRLECMGHLGDWVSYADVAHLKFKHEELKLDIWLCATTQHFDFEMPEIFELYPIQPQPREEE